MELEKTMPHRGEICNTPEGKGRITDRNLLTQSVMVTFDSGNTKRYNVSEITVLSRKKDNSTAREDEH